MHPMSPNSKVWKMPKPDKTVKLTLVFAAKIFSLGWKKLW